MKVVLGILVDLGLGVFCRWLGILLPSPPKVIGVVMVLAVTLGFVVADWALTCGQAAAPEQGQATPNEVGPAGIHLPVG
jgi:XapX domain-containing protein